ncbi:ABC transporter substrate-binding protein [Vagococcus intermedius]|uniref:ABC transporter substrate-binding protein n=1 Tax=Vagococcus intermedius TaxID=2991418 RepID=A0AAF0CVJ2_9ENTE|nr:ABC transporter substrate-binding protein [Vagococcus intermedius]WEG73673.1 ABC transporter substrate-binding protein [Vagococcus intermedius]WEG75757.1 ABC transporter substrate-binding protein [Vagococcus intermedius]
MAIIRLHQNRINPLVLPVILAKELGFFDKRKVEVELRLADDFVFQGKNEFLLGEVDAVMGDTTFFFYYLEEGKQAKITSNLTRTIQLVDNGMTDDETTFVVGVNRRGLFRFFQQYFMPEQLKNASLKWLNNTYERMEAMRKGEINSLVAIEPFIADVQTEFNSRVVWHSNQIEHYFVMWCFDSQFVEENPQTVRHFHEALEEASSYFNQLSAEDKVITYQTYAKVPLAKAEAMSQFNFEEQKNYQSDDFNLCQKWMKDEGEISQLYEAERYIFAGIESKKEP